MDSIRPFLDLPLATLAPLAAGYVGYRFAFVGRDGAHRAVDVVFLSLVFALAGKMLMMAVGAWTVPGAIVAVAGAVFLGSIWRDWGASRSFDWLRRRGLLAHDGQPDVWRSMLARKLPPPLRLVVYLTNGQRLMCSDLRPFYGEPLGPCLFGEDGSVALFVTDYRDIGSDKWTEVRSESQENEEWAPAITLVPASEIARVRITRLKSVA